MKSQPGAKFFASRASEGDRPHLPIALLPFLCFLIYANTFKSSFHYDDNITILDKPWIRGLSRIPEFIFSFGSRPLLILTFNLNYWISGFDIWSWHLVNIAIHAINSILLYQLIKKSYCFRTALYTSIIFAVHPLNTEAVTYISSRSSLLATTFYLLTIMAWRKPFFCAVFFIAGMLVKSVVITAPVMAFLYHFNFVSKNPLKKWIVETTPALIGTAVVTIGFIVSLVYHGGSLLPGGQTRYSAFEYSVTEPYVILTYYLSKMLFPLGLSVDIDSPLIRHFTSAMIFGIILYAAIPMLAFRLKKGIVPFGMSWFVIAFLPTSSFVPLLDLVNEHHTYLPIIGFCMVAGTILTNYRKFFIAVMLILCVLTIQRNTVWKDEATLWKDAALKYPKLIRPHNNLGKAYDDLGLYDEAIKQFNEALAIQPRYAFALSNLGNIHGKKNELDKAVYYFQQALLLEPDHAITNYNMALALVKIGRYQEALEYYNRAIKSDPFLDVAWHGKYELYARFGMAKEANGTLDGYLKIRKELKVRTQNSSESLHPSSG